MTQVSAVPAWSVAECSHWATSHTLPDPVREALEANEVDGTTLLHLSAQDIREELGIRSLRHRKALMDAVERLRCTSLVDDFSYALMIQREEAVDFIKDAETLADVGTCCIPRGDKAQVDEVSPANILIASVDDAITHIKDFEVASQFDKEDIAARDTMGDYKASCELQVVCDAARAVEAYDHQVARRLSNAPREPCDTLFSLALRACVKNRINVAEALRDGQVKVIKHPDGDSSSCDHGVEELKEEVAEDLVESKEEDPPQLAPVAECKDDAMVEGDALPELTCDVCADETGCYELPCGDHKFCKSCLTKLFMTASKDITLIPVHCCRVEIDPNLADVLMRGESLDRFRRLHVESSTTSKMYCPSCSGFISLDLVDTDSGNISCPHCNKALCTLCKSLAHPGQLICPTEDDPVLDLAQENGWKHCPRCNHIIGLDSGCNHMTCVCGHEFCFRCQSNWYVNAATQERACGCDLFDHAHLDDAVNAAVQAQERVRGRRYEVDERQDQYRRAENGLLRHEDCNHDWNRVQPPTEDQCRNCGFDLNVYGFRCEDCNYVACHTCRFFRIRQRRGY